MQFQLEDAIAILSHTPAALDAMVRGLPEPWLHANEGPETWSPFDVVGHLVAGERTDWVTRLRLILEHGDKHPFEPFNRTAMFEESKGKTIAELLDTFATLRAQNLETVRALQLEPADFARRGMHPSLGSVTLEQLLATWVTHDMTHMVQISRVIAKQFKDEVGPWREYIGVLNR
jgi:uncharacterized damage-inducible protein DinB